MLIRTLVENKPIQLVPGTPICITDDPALAGKYDNLFVIDSPGFATKLRSGDKISLNYGTVEMTVDRFETRDSFFSYHENIEEIKIQKQKSANVRSKASLNTA